jgi:1,4-dihydroxy-6-naphthoate synthase
MEITLGFSPCPNDTFIFDAMINQRINTENVTFKPVMEDVETLNKMAFNQQLHVTKLSYHALSYMLDNYVLLNAGSALGNNCGPLLVAKSPLSQSQIENATIAIPGKYTTANFLLSLAFPKAIHKKEMVFSEIENSILSGNTDLGLIIHENRFTYAEKGLVKIMDLGEFWEAKTHSPIPLGGIVAQRSLPLALIKKIDRVLRRSVEYAFAHPEASKPFIRAHAQAMDEQVMQQHIDLYVNQYTLNLGRNGRKAVRNLFQTGFEQKIIPDFGKNIFL